MASAIEMPLRGGISSTDAHAVAQLSGGTPPFFHWVKIGFAFAVGVWAAAVLLFIPSFLLLMRFYALLLDAWIRGFSNYR